MFKTLRTTFSLKNTYRVNSILYAIKQMPVLKKLLPDALYGVRGLKVFANILSVLWEIIAAFGGKLLYMLLMIVVAASLYPGGGSGRLFLHIFVCLTVIGSFVNTYMFNPTRDKYYALALLRMDARAYVLVNYGYEILKVLAGFLIFGFIFGLGVGISWWECLLMPFFVAGIKLCVAAYALWDYERTGVATNENKLGRLLWVTVFVLLAAAYGLPALKIMLPEAASVALMAVCTAAGLVSVHKILAFKCYGEVYQQLLAQMMNQMDTAKTIVRTQSQKIISADTGITSSRRGFEYLNELFVKRHRKILWKSARKIAAVSTCLILGVLLLFYIRPVVKENVNGLLMGSLPYFVFIMYAINRGTGFTNALFMNCDHSMLTYAFYKQPDFVLELFKIRLREIMKVNLLPALVIGGGLAVLLYASGGTDNPVNYAVLFVSVICMSIFFSVHYLTVYYLLQPYNAGTEIKSGTYRVVMYVTYFFCFFFMKVKMPTFVFGIMTIVFCALYCIVACVLVYRLAPKTFRLRL